MSEVGGRLQWPARMPEALGALSQVTEKLRTAYPPHFLQEHGEDQGEARLMKGVPVLGSTICGAGEDRAGGLTGPCLS